MVDTFHENVRSVLKSSFLNVFPSNKGIVSTNGKRDIALVVFKDFKKLGLHKSDHFQPVIIVLLSLSPFFASLFPGKI